MDLGLVCCFRMDHTNWVLVSTTDMGRNRRCSDDAELRLPVKKFKCSM